MQGSKRPQRKEVLIGTRYANAWMLDVKRYARKNATLMETINMSFTRNMDKHDQELINLFLIMHKSMQKLHASRQGVVQSG